ncbi:hypothetical protein SEA_NECROPHOXINUS_108 [Microbacterium phage Necrophoxinus]|nr:hypothetical protein SEA_NECROPHOXINUS_108 [Microbacterium phage Necrophoxinus]
MSGAARKARKRSGEKFIKAQKTPTVRYTERGKAVHGLPPAMSVEDWQNMMATTRAIMQKAGVDVPWYLR